MLLYKPDVLPEVAKPISEIAVGESFTVTVTLQDWKRGEAHREDAMRSRSCAVAQALVSRFGGGASVGLDSAGLFATDYAPRTKLSHDGIELVKGFDHGDSFPGPTVVTFTRES